MNLVSLILFFNNNNKIEPQEDVEVDQLAVRVERGAMIPNPAQANSEIPSPRNVSVVIGRAQPLAPPPVHVKGTLSQYSEAINVSCKYCSLAAMELIAQDRNITPPVVDENLQRARALVKYNERRGPRASFETAIQDTANLKVAQRFPVNGTVPRIARYRVISERLNVANELMSGVLVTQGTAYGVAFDPQKQTYTISDSHPRDGAVISAFSTAQAFEAHLETVAPYRDFPTDDDMDMETLKLNPNSFELTLLKRK